MEAIVFVNYFNSQKIKMETTKEIKEIDEESFTCLKRKLNTPSNRLIRLTLH